MPRELPEAELGITQGTFHEKELNLWGELCSFGNYHKYQGTEFQHLIYFLSYHHTPQFLGQYSIRLFPAE